MNLNENSTGQNVLYLQFGIRILNCNPHHLDGIYGPKTKEAVKKYQTMKKIQADGITGDITWGCLIADITPVQKALQKKGYYSGTIDGIAGSLTYQGLLKFQTDSQLVPDGICGKATSALLYSSASQTSKPASAAAIALKTNNGAFIAQYAAKYGIAENVLGGTILVESSGSGFSNKKLKIRFENHIFLNMTNNFTKDIYFAYGSPSWTGHKYRKNKDADWTSCHSSQTVEHDIFQFAASLNEREAYESISMGLGQIMGFNYKAAGYASPMAMFQKFSVSELEQLSGMLTFITSNKVQLAALQNGDYRTFVSRYNGNGNVDAYYEKLVDAIADYESV